MAHPDFSRVRNSVEKRIALGDFDMSPAVLPGLGIRDLGTEGIADQLHPITNPQNRNPEFKNTRVTAGGAVFVDAARSPGKNQSAWLVPGNLLGSNIVPHDLAIDMLLAHPSGDQLGKLRTKIEHQDPLLSGAGRRGGR